MTTKTPLGGLKIAVLGFSLELMHMLHLERRMLNLIS